jgi:ectoine hydroxylase-related dioxygenase (phytanoyl-CoA dioxygenase family)
MLSAAQLERYDRDGFLIVPRLFSCAELQPVMDEIDGLVDDLANRLHAAGKIREQHEREGFYTRLTRLEQEFPGAAVLIHIGGILRPELRALWCNPKLLEIVEQLLGPEICGHPVWNLRSKTPTNPLVTVPWHQDTAYLAAGSEKTFQPTAWIPLLDADAENGTLQVVRGGHRSGRVFPHRLENSRGHKASWYLYIDERDLPEGEVVTCNMKMGDVLLLNNLIPHRSTENLSDKIRWSIDLRWQRPGERSGFEGIKDCILMRTKRDASYQPDWESWSKQNRIADAMLDKEQRKDADFNTSVSGPWMERWKESPARSVS